MKKDVHVAASYYEQSASQGNEKAVISLATMYEEEKELEDLDKAAHYLHLLICKGYSRKEYDFKRLLNSGKVNWKPQYHKYWQYKSLNNSLSWRMCVMIKQSIFNSILTVFLVSKHINVLLHSKSLQVLVT